MAHGRARFQEDEEDHCTPGDHVQAVDHDKEAKRSQEEFPESFEPNGSRLLPGVFGREAVSIGIHTRLVRVNKISGVRGGLNIFLGFRSVGLGGTMEERSVSNHKVNPPQKVDDLNKNNQDCFLEKKV